MTKKIKIIAIVDRKTVLINAGSNDGINDHQEFNIIDGQPVIIKDPDTGEILDKFNRYKQKLYVKEVRPKYSICVSKYKISTMNSSLGASLASRVISSAAVFQVSDQVEHEIIGKDMNVENSEVNDILSPYSYAKIHVNDEVKLIINK